jgi:uncharacterized membrane protein (DUF2068 family)
MTDAARPDDCALTSTDPGGTGAAAPQRDRIFKFCKATVLIAIAIGALKLIGSDLHDRAKAIFEALGQSVDVVPVLKLLRNIGAIQPHQARLIAAFFFAYAALFLVEGTGLWLQRRWAEYLTVVATGSFIPFEIYELVRRVTLPRAGALVINIVVLLYLIYKLRSTAHRHR